MYKQLPTSDIFERVVALEGEFRRYLNFASRLNPKGVGNYHIGSRYNSKLTNAGSIAFLFFDVFTIIYFMVVQLLWYPSLSYTPNTMFFVYYFSAMMIGCHMVSLYRQTKEAFVFEMICSLVSFCFTLWMFLNQFSGAYTDDTAFNNTLRYNGTTYFSTFSGLNLVIITLSPGFNNSWIPTTNVWYWATVGVTALLIIMSLVHLVLSFYSYCNDSWVDTTLAPKPPQDNSIFDENGVYAPLRYEPTVDRLRLAGSVLAMLIIGCAFVLTVLCGILYSEGQILPDYFNSPDFFLYFTAVWALWPPSPGKPPKTWNKYALKNIIVAKELKDFRDNLLRNHLNDPNFKVENIKQIADDEFYNVWKQWGSRTSDKKQEELHRRYGSFSTLYILFLFMMILSMGISIGTLIGLSSWRSIQRMPNSQTQYVPSICTNPTSFQNLVGTTYSSSQTYSYFNGVVNVTYAFSGNIGNFESTIFANIICASDWLRIIPLTLLGFIFFIHLAMIYRDRKSHKHVEEFFEARLKMEQEMINPPIEQKEIPINSEPNSDVEPLSAGLKEEPES